MAETVVFLRSPGPLSPAIQTLGAGCPGTGGVVAQIAAPVLPTAGEPAFAVQLGQALPQAGALLLLAVDDAAFPLGGGCTLWLLPPLFQVVTATSSAGDAALAFAIPNAASVMGAELALQWVVVDPAGAFGSTLAFSGGLLARIGS